MEFSSRIKKEMTEGIVKAILEDAGYRVIDSGIEKFIRELSVLLPEEYKSLGFPDAMSQLPDFTVLTKNQDEKFFVEVKYRKKWDAQIFESVKEQVMLYGSLVLISINASAEDPKDLNGPSRYLRCCKLRFKDDTYSVKRRLRDSNGNIQLKWTPVSSLEDETWLWWSMSPLQEVFTGLNATTRNSSEREKTLYKAIAAIQGILDDGRAVALQPATFGR